MLNVCFLLTVTVHYASVYILLILYARRRHEHQDGESYHSARFEAVHSLLLAIAGLAKLPTLTLVTGKVTVGPPGIPQDHIVQGMVLSLILPFNGYIEVA